ncbi:MAG: hypothetical protein ACT4NV_08580 [Rhodoferax sp.]
MKPAALLELWRDRWAKPPVSALFVPYRDGPLSQHLEAFATSALWRSPGLRWGGRLLACLGLLTLAFMPLTVNAQIVFAAILLATLVYARRFGGAVLALGIACVSAVMSMRYLGWRVHASIVPGYPLETFVWGMLWWSAEVLAWVGATLLLLERFWPLQRPPQPLPPQALHWPDVDAIVWSDTADPVALRLQVQALRSQAWPANRLGVHVVCAAAPSEQERAWAQEQGMALVHYPECAQAPWGQINRLLWDLQGSVVVVVHASTPPLEANFLQHSLGWLHDDAALALLHTPAHPCTGGASAPVARQLRQRCDPRAQVAVWRRQALNDIAGLDLQHPDGSIRQLRARGWESAHLLIQNPAPGEPGATQTVARMDRPFPAYGLRARMAMEHLAEVLRFYQPLYLGVFALTPLVALGLGSLPLQASLLALCAFYLPHWIMASLARGASEPGGRLVFSLLLREHILPLHLAVRTTQSFLATQWRHVWRRLRHTPPPRDPPLDARLWLTQLAWAGANLWAALQGARLLQQGPGAAYTSTLGVMVAWALWNALQAICRLAIEKEARLVQSTRDARQTMQAMVQTPGQRPLPCTTSNFPSQTLVLGLHSVPTGMRPGQTLAFSLFHGYHEYTFDAQLTAIDPNTLQLQVAPASVEAYRKLAQAVFSRDAQWPRWLPGREADHLLPSRLRTVLHALETAFYNLVVQASKPPLIQLLKQWLQPGTKNNG